MENLEAIKNCIETIKSNDKTNDEHAISRLKFYIEVEENRLKKLEEELKKSLTIKKITSECLEMIKKHFNIDDEKSEERLKRYIQLEKRFYGEEHKNKKDFMFACYKQVKFITNN